MMKALPLTALIPMSVTPLGLRSASPAHKAGRQRHRRRRATPQSRVPVDQGFQRTWLGVPSRAPSAGDRRAGRNARTGRSAIAAAGGSAAKLKAVPPLSGLIVVGLRVSVVGPLPAGTGRHPDARLGGRSDGQDAPGGAPRHQYARVSLPLPRRYRRPRTRTCVRCATSQYWPAAPPSPHLPMASPPPARPEGPMDEESAELRGHHNGRNARPGRRNLPQLRHRPLRRSQGDRCGRSRRSSDGGDRSHPRHNGEARRPFISARGGSSP